MTCNAEPITKKRNEIMDIYEAAMRRTRETIIKVRKTLIKDRLRKKRNDSMRVLT